MVYDILEVLKKSIMNDKTDKILQGLQEPQWRVPTKKLKVGQPVWAVVDEDGELVAVFTHEVTRNTLVMHDSERIVEGWFTPKE